MNKSFYLISVISIVTLLLNLQSCKEPDDITGNPPKQDDLLFQSFQTLNLASEKMIEIGDSLGITPLEALYYTEQYLQNVPGVEDAYKIDTAHLKIITTGGYSSTIFIDIIGPDGLSIYRGGPGSGGFSKLTSSSSGNCSNKIENKKVLLYAATAYDFYAPNEFQTKVVDAIKGGDVDVEVTAFKNINCTLDLLYTFDQYGLVILDTHGDPDAIQTGVTFIWWPEPIPNSVGEFLITLGDKLGGQQYVPLVVDHSLSLGSVFKYDDGLLVQETWDRYKSGLDRPFFVWLTSKGVRNIIPDLSGTILFANACYSGFTSTTYTSNGEIHNVDPIKVAWMTKNPRTLYAYEAGNGISYAAPNAEFCKPNEDTLIHSLFYHGDSTGIAHLSNGTDIAEYPWSPMLTDAGNHGPLKFNQYNQVNWCYGECGEPFVDNRDMQEYATVCIGDQVWMAENLNWAGAGQCYDNDPAYCNTFGRLYTWSEATNDSSSATNPSGVTGVCPGGWHIPSEAEWTELINHLGGGAIAGGKLKATTMWVPPNTGATNSSGFSALPGGYMTKPDDVGYWDFGQNGYNTFFWIGTLDSSYIYHYFETHQALRWDEEQIHKGPYGSVRGRWGAYVRCVKD